MRTLIKIILSVFALTIIVSSCGGDSYAKKLDREKKTIKNFLDENNLRVTNTYPVVFDENEFYHDLRNDLYYQVVDSGLGEKARPYIAPGNINAQSGTEVSVRYDSAYYLLDMPKDSIVYFNSKQGGIQFVFGQPSTYNGTESPYDFLSSALVMPLEHVREGAIIRMIIPFNSGSVYQMYSYTPVYIHKLEYTKFK